MGVWTLDKDPLRRLCVWTHKKKVDFCIIVALSGGPIKKTLCINTKKIGRFLNDSCSVKDASVAHF